MPSTPPPSLTEANEPDPFLRLHKMSTTAGLGSGDYVAINAASLAALLLGIASGLVLWGSLFLLAIPLIGILCAILAYRQITNSNGTQTGRGMATIGLLLSLGLGGGFSVKAMIDTLHDKKEQEQVIALLDQFGQLIRDGKYEQAYALTDDHFHARVPLSQFAESWKLMSGSSIRGNITGTTWNGLLKFDVDPLTDQHQASGIMLIGFAKIPSHQRIGVAFSQTSDGWRINEMPDMFPTEATAPPARPARGSSGLIGPPAPSKSK